MNSYRWPNLCEMFFQQAETNKDKPFLWQKKGSEFVALSWSEVAHSVTILASHLRALGVKDGDRVVIVCESRPEWCISDLAIMSAGAITVPAYTTNTTRDHLHILENSGAKAAIISSKSLGKSFLPAAHQSDAMQVVISMENQDISQKINAQIYDWQEILSKGAVDEDEIRNKVKNIPGDKTACLIYTSGTGGAPKGVMLHHKSIMHNCVGATEITDMLTVKQHRFLSFLPLSHAYEHSAGQFFPISLGAEIFYAQSLDKLATNFIETRPTVMTVVPRLFEMLRLKITRGIENEGGLKKTLFLRALSLGEKRHLGTQSIFNRLENIILDILVRRKVKDKFGGKIEALISGGAPLNAEVGMFFWSLGLPLLQGYGQTESAPVISAQRPGDLVVGTVGPPLKNTNVKIAEDGEILVQGDLVMQGYWHNDDATKAVLIDGWLHTGDVGHIDENGHINITDRKKDIIVLDKGDNVSPQRIEGILSLEAEIAQAMIYGEGKPHLVALLVPDPDWLKEWAKENNKEGSSIGALHQDEDLKKSLSAVLTRVNATLSNLEKLRRFTLAWEGFSIENTQMTPTLKIRRHIISAEYEEDLERLYKKS
jgi:long-chain acyl-CoA synthetase